MADWYVSSAAYAAATLWSAGATKAVGAFVVPTAPTAHNKWVFRCSAITTGITGGTQPTWPSGANATVVDGGVTWQNVTGQSAYFWSAAAGDMGTLQGEGSQANQTSAGDRMFVSSDHSETQSSGTMGTTNIATGFGVFQILSVNRAGSTPPVAADLLAGAAFIFSGTNLVIECSVNLYIFGMTLEYTGTSTGIQFGNVGIKTINLDTCALWLNSSTSTLVLGNNSACKTKLNNTTVQFGATGQAFKMTSNQHAEFVWENTPNAIQGATIPTILFENNQVSATMTVTCRGVDLSAITTTLVQNSNNGQGGMLALFEGCKINSGVTRWSATGSSNTRDLVQLIYCYDGTHIISESYQIAGTLTTETTITLSGGAQDNVGSFSHKLVSTTSIDDFCNTLDAFPLDVDNTLTGASHTATVEIISSGTLTNADISLTLEYMGTSGSSVQNFVSDFVGPIAGATNVPSSSATWNSSPATPVPQHLQVTFTPQEAGRLRGLVKLGKASTTVYVNPQITVT